MPRNYKPAPTARRQSKHDVRTLEAAVRDVKGGISLRQASRRYGIARSVIHRRLKGFGDRHIGGQPILSEEIELSLVNCIQTCGSWGYPLSMLDIRLFVKGYLDSRGITLKRFKNNFPGHDWAKSFLKRHHEAINERMCQNIKRSRAAVSPTIL